MTCSTCRFWQHIEEGSGQCRRYAPKPEQALTHVQWAKTDGSDWCGEFQPSAEIPKPKKAKKE